MAFLLPRRRIRGLAPELVPADRSGCFSRALGALLLLFVFAGVPSLHAQVNRSSIQGYVFDPSGAVIADAKVSISDADHSILRETTTNSSGSYYVLGLVPAVY